MSNWRLNEPRHKDEDGWLLLKQRVDREQGTVTYTFYTKRKWWQFGRPKIVVRTYGIAEIRGCED